MGITPGAEGFPEDLSIIGFDNIDLTQFCDPPLTTIAQPREIKGDAMGLKERFAEEMRYLRELGYVGVMAMECFVTPQGLLINELAPRVHNSDRLAGFPVEHENVSGFRNLDQCGQRPPVTIRHVI